MSVTTSTEIYTTSASWLDRAKKLFSEMLALDKNNGKIIKEKKDEKAKKQETQKKTSWGLTGDMPIEKAPQIKKPEPIVKWNYLYTNKKGEGKYYPSLTIAPLFNFESMEKNWIGYAISSLWNKASFYMPIFGLKARTVRLMKLYLRDAEQKAGGYTPDALMGYLQWHDGWNYLDFVSTFCKVCRSMGKVPMITWMPAMERKAVDESGGQIKSPYFLDELIEALQDEHSNVYKYAVAFAEDAKKYGDTLYLRPFHEMNLQKSYQWTGYQNGGGNDVISLVEKDKDGNYRLLTKEELKTRANQPNKIADGPERLIASWLILRQIFIDQQADNVKFVWCPEADPHFKADEGKGKIKGWNDYISYYPGNKNVDMIGFDVYQRDDKHTFMYYFDGTKHDPKDPNLGMTGRFLTYIREHTKGGSEVPVSICEASTTPEIFRVKFIQQLFAYANDHGFKYVFWFNENKKEEGVEQIYRFDAKVNDRKKSEKMYNIRDVNANEIAVLRQKLFALDRTLYQQLADEGKDQDQIFKIFEEKHPGCTGLAIKSQEKAEVIQTDEAYIAFKKAIKDFTDSKKVKSVKQVILEKEYRKTLNLATKDLDSYNKAMARYWKEKEAEPRQFWVKVREEIDRDVYRPAKVRNAVETKKGPTIFASIAGFFLDLFVDRNAPEQKLGYARNLMKGWEMEPETYTELTYSEILQKQKVDPVTHANQVTGNVLFNKALTVVNNIIGYSNDTQATNNTGGNNAPITNKIQITNEMSRPYPERSYLDALLLKRELLMKYFLNFGVKTANENLSNPFIAEMEDVCEKILMLLENEDYLIRLNHVRGGVVLTEAEIMGLKALVHISLGDLYIEMAETGKDDSKLSDVEKKADSVKRADYAKRAKDEYLKAQKLIYGTDENGDLILYEKDKNNKKIKVNWKERRSGEKEKYLNYTYKIGLARVAAFQAQSEDEILKAVKILSDVANTKEEIDPGIGLKARFYMAKLFKNLSKKVSDPSKAQDYASAAISLYESLSSTEYSYISSQDLTALKNPK